MGEITAVLDSNIVIDALHDRIEALRLLEAPGIRAVSVISWIEVMAGCDAADEEKCKSVLGRFPVLYVTAEIAALSARIRQSKSLKLPDAVVYATALVYGCPLLTRNTKDFPAGMVGVEVPYRL